MTLKLMVSVARLATWVLLFWVFVTAGLRWQAVARPIPKVEITFEAGQQLSGELRTNWNGSKTLLDAASTSHHINESDIILMTIPANEAPKPFPWRAFTPLFIFTLVTTWRALEQVRKQTLKDRNNA